MKRENPPAFSASSNVAENSGDKLDLEGMSLRDYFAAKAMTMLPVPKDCHWGNGQSDGKPDWAKRAYGMADAMLKERNK